MDTITTLKGSLMEGFHPKGWDLEKIQECCRHDADEATERQPFWSDGFQPVPCDTVATFNVKMGHEMARQIAQARHEGRELAMILPVGPTGMYAWVVYFLREWNIPCDHLHCFNMDEWSDAQGNTLPEEQPGSFKRTMQRVFYEPLGALTVPQAQRNFATRDNLPLYPEKIAALKKRGVRLVTVYGIGRDFHIAFCEPHFAQEFDSDESWKKAPYWLGAKLHPLSIEQNAISSFRGSFTDVPCFANTIGPGLFLQSDYAIGGLDRALERGVSLHTPALWVTLRYGPTRWVPSSYMPTMPGRLFYVRALAEAMPRA